MIPAFEEGHIPEPNTGCWLWVAGRTTAGYGQLRVRQPDGSRLKVYAHRYAYELYRGPIPEGMQIDHLCRVRCCCNPFHLDVVTNRENVLRGIVAEVHRARARLRTACNRGHPYSENTRVNKRGARRCNVCENAGKRRRRANGKLG